MQQCICSKSSQFYRGNKSVKSSIHVLNLSGDSGSPQVFKISQESHSGDFQKGATYPVVKKKKKRSSVMFVGQEKKALKRVSKNYGKNIYC